MEFVCLFAMKLLQYFYFVH